jgi:hypothetical protein
MILLSARRSHASGDLPPRQSTYTLTAVKFRMERDVMISVSQCADYAGLDSNELLIGIAPSARHHVLLASYLLNLRRGGVVLRNMIRDDIRWLSCGYHFRTTRKPEVARRPSPFGDTFRVHIGALLKRLWRLRSEFQQAATPRNDCLMRHRAVSERHVALDLSLKR